jgi:hypothetical protein
MHFEIWPCFRFDVNLLPVGHGSLWVDCQDALDYHPPTIVRIGLRVYESCATIRVGLLCDISAYHALFIFFFKNTPSSDSYLLEASGESQLQVTLEYEHQSQDSAFPLTTSAQYNHTSTTT